MTGFDEQVPVDGSQVGVVWHSACVQTVAGLVWQTPPWQVFGCWHLSLVLQKAPSLIGVTVHEEVPLQIRDAQASLTQLIEVPTQLPELQASPYVQAFPSSQAVPLTAVPLRHDLQAPVQYQT